jgi:hypothetical protein
MAAQHNVQSLQIQGRIDLALNFLRSNLSQSCRRLAKLYNVPRSTLKDRLKGVPAKHATTLVNRRLRSVEQESLIQWILDLDRRGFPHIIDVRRMADALLAARGQNPPPCPIGKNWVTRFVKSHPLLQTK